MNIRICRLCAGVSSLWLILSAGVAWSYLSLQTFLVPIALLMGGTVVGIAYQRYSLRWKTTVILLGMPLAYLLVTNLSKTTVIIEFILLVIIAYALFVRKEPADHERIRELEEKMKNCC